MKIFLFYSMFILMFTSCVHKINHPPTQNNIHYYKLHYKNTFNTVAGAEYWFDADNSTYLYANFLIYKDKIEITQRIFFNPDYTLKAVFQEMYKNNFLTISGCFVSQDKKYLLFDQYGKRRREFYFEKSVLVLHPTKIIEHLALDKNKVTNTKYAYLMWRDDPPFLNEFRVNFLVPNQFEIYLKSKTDVLFRTQDKKIDSVNIKFNDPAHNDVVMLSSNLNELNSFKNIDFNLDSSLMRLKNLQNKSVDDCQNSN